MGISLDDAYKTFQISNLDPKENSLSQAERDDIAEAEAQMEAVRAKYQGTDQWLKAPNGNPTKLNERQWLQVRTDNFKKGFGDWENDPKNASKVIDENGEPMVVYHGGKFSTDTGIPDVVGRQRKNWQLSFGMHFSESIEEAKDYQKMSKGSLTEVFLNLRNPLYAEPTQNEHGESQFHSIDKALYESMPTNLRKVYDKQYGNALKETKTGYGYTEWMENSLEKLSPQEAKMALEEMGFDGVKYLASKHGIGKVSWI